MLTRAAPRVAVTAALVVTVAAQFYVLYAPTGPGPGWLPPGGDKLVHAVVFGVPVILGALAGLPVRLVVAVLVVHAPLSETIQHLWLPNRSGDPWDVVADLAGVLIGWLAVRRVPRRRDGLSEP